MAVIVKYIVVRNGEEKMTFATKKEADAYDKMLDIADNMFEFLDKSELKLPEDQMEQISLLLAENRDVVMPILRGINPKKQPPAKQKKSSEKPGEEARAGKTADSPASKQKTAKK
jgi:dsDNA-binding SOS-regulon protein